MILEGCGYELLKQILCIPSLCLKTAVNVSNNIIH